jgi:hypothetical protein
MTNIHVGDNNSTYGANSPINIGRVNGQDTEFLISQLISAVQEMRGQVPVSAQQIADDFLALAASPAKPDKRRLRDALLQLGTMATLVGQVGVPVIEAIDKLRTALGL